MAASSNNNTLGYRINYREGTISVSERLIKEANREGVNSTALTPSKPCARWECRL